MPEGTLLQADPGAPFEHGDEPVAAPPAAKSDLDKRFDALERTNQDLAEQLRQSREDTRFWAERNRDGGPRAAEPDDEPAPIIEDDDLDEKPEQFLDDVSKDGSQALKKRGFVTQADLDRAVRDAETRTEARVSARLNESGFDAKLASEFPELVAESNRIKAAGPGARSTDPLFRRGGQIFQEMGELDENLKTSKSALLVAFRQARAELKAEQGGKSRANDDGNANDEPRVPTRQSIERRERIERQMQAPSRNDDRNDERPTVSSEAREVMGRLGVTEEQFVKNRDRAAKEASRGKR